MLMLYPDLGEKGTTETLDEIKGLLDSFGASIFHEDVLGVRDLAYRIKRQDQAYYIVWNMDLPGEHVSELEKALNINQGVIRYLLMKTPVNYEVVSLNKYEEEAKKERAEQEEKKAEKKKKRSAKPAPKPKAKPAPAKPKKEESPEEVDAKLESIIDDPDISL